MTAIGPERITLLTYNILAHDHDWPRRRPVIAAELRRLAPDILLLQKTMVFDGYDQVIELFGDGYHVAHSAKREANGQGISVLSRWPIEALHEPDFRAVSSRTADFACTALIAAIEAPEPFRRMLTVNHFPDFQTDHELERERQAVVLARTIEAMLKDHPAHVIVGGDLDAEPDAASLRFLMGKQALEGMSVCYRNAWDSAHPGEPGGTFVRRNPLVPRAWPFARIDHILVRCGANGQPTLAITGCDLVLDAPVDGVWPSNHFGLLATSGLPHA